VAKLNLDAIVATLNKKNSGLSLNVHDFQPINSQLARVVLTVNTLDVSAEELYHAVCSKFNEQVSPVAGSFRRLASTVMPAIHGFVARNAEVVAYTKENASRYRQTASNILMDKEDESLWTMRKTASGTFLVRDVNSEIGELVQLAKINSVKHQRVPTCSSVVVPALEVGEIAAYINPDICELEHGYVIASLNNGTHYEIAALGEQESQAIPADLIVAAAFPNDSDREASPQVAAPQSMTDKAALREYYSRIYSYNPSFYENFVKGIDALAVM
jgi:hypothetical protein